MSELPLSFSFVSVDRVTGPAMNNVAMCVRRLCSSLHRVQNGAAWTSCRRTPLGTLCRAFSAANPGSDIASVIDAVWEIKEVPSTAGTASDVAAEKFRRTYSALDGPNRSIALVTLANSFQLDAEKLATRCEDFAKSWREGKSPTSVQLKGLEHALRPVYKKVFTSVGYLPAGVKFLVDFRADLLKEISTNIKAGKPDVAQDLREMDTILFDLMTVWFGRGFLSLQRVTWNSPCGFLEKVAGGEAVHPVRHWRDLKRRLGAYRRCFAFTHQSMPGEPLIVVHSALMPSITTSIKSITKAYLDDNHIEEEENVNNIDAAIFYSISALQHGLRSVELGGHLIKKVVDHIRWEYPHLTKFSTLSPIPGFRAWLLVRLHEAARGGDQNVLTPTEMSDWKKVLGEEDFWKNAVDAIMKSSWCKTEEKAKHFRAGFTRLCARYLFLEKHRGYALDPVANFHLRNGAVLWRINFMADMTPRGLEKSCGMMVNYRYFLETVETYSRRYIDKKVVAVEDSIAELALQHT